MAANLSKYVNKTILVSIPPLSGDIKCRPYKLTGIELIGLWLEGADLARDFLAPEHKSDRPTTWTFFVPYSQIACVAIGTMPAVVGEGRVVPATVVVKPSPAGSATSQKKPKT